MPNTAESPDFLRLPCPILAGCSSSGATLAPACQRRKNWLAMLPNKINRMDDGKGSHGVIYLCHEIGPRQCVVKTDGCAVPLSVVRYYAAMAKRA